MMFRIALLFVFSFLACLPAGAASLTADGSRSPVVPGVSPPGERAVLINDGSFEFGKCDQGSAWTCTRVSDDPPEIDSWILNPIPIWGYPAYHGVLAAWLGGFNYGYPNQNSFCQEIFVDWLYLDWRWMGYVNSACGTLTVTCDGRPVFSHTMRYADHSYGTWKLASESIGGAWLWDFFAHVTMLCFEWTACPDGVSNDNMLIDYLTLQVAGGVGTEVLSFSAVKALY